MQHLDEGTSSAITVDQTPAPSTQPLPLVVRGQWKVYLLLLGMTVIGAATMLPFSLHLIKQTPSALPPNISKEMFDVIIVIAVIVQDLILTAALAPLGLWLGTRVGLGAPILGRWVGAEPAPPRSLQKGLIWGTVAGVVSAVAIIGLNFVFEPFIKPPRPISMPPPWQGFLAAIGAGITEEIWTRLGLMSFFVWLGARLTRRQSPGAGIVWTGNILAALLFGAMHLPQAATFLGLTPIVVALVLVMNGIGGVMFGWLYWRHSLVAAMWAHFIADVVLKALWPAIH